MLVFCLKKNTYTKTLLSLNVVDMNTNQLIIIKAFWYFSATN